MAFEYPQDCSVVVLGLGVADAHMLFPGLRGAGRVYMFPRDSVGHTAAALPRRPATGGGGDDRRKAWEVGEAREAVRLGRR